MAKDDTDAIRLSMAILGDAGVGKTPLFERFLQEAAKGPLKARISRKDTPGVLMAMVNLSVDGHAVVLKLSDFDQDHLTTYLCEGREAFNPFGNQCFVIAYDETRKSTYESVPSWLEKIEEYSPHEETVSALVGMRKALNDIPEVEVATAQAFASAGEMVHSTVTGDEPVQHIFIDLLNKIIPRYAVTIVREGTLTKQGAVVKNWKERSFTLDSAGVIRYYKPGKSEPQGRIDLRQCTGVRDGSECQVAWPKDADVAAGFGIVTAGRTYHIFAKSAADASAWKSAFEPFVGAMHRKSETSISGHVKSYENPGSTDEEEEEGKEGKEGESSEEAEEHGKDAESE